MSKIMKIKCDKCNKELDEDAWYYKANLISQSEKYSNAKQIMNGDYCEDCFGEIIVKEMQDKILNSKQED